MANKTFGELVDDCRFVEIQHNVGGVVHVFNHVNRDNFYLRPAEWATLRDMTPDDNQPVPGLAEATARVRLPAAGEAREGVDTMNVWTRLQGLAQSQDTPDDPLAALGALDEATRAAYLSLLCGEDPQIVDDVMAAQYDSAGGRHGHQKGGDR
jgi:hypothetical protein